MSAKHPVDRKGGRGRFDHLAERASNFSSSPAFFVLCLGTVALWIAGYALGLSDSFHHVTGDAMAAITLLLVAVLKNSELRAEHAVQEKLDAIAAALLESREDEHGDAQRELERAIGLHDEV